MPGRPHHTEKFRSCVEQVIAKGESEDSAYAICTTSLQKAGEEIFVAEAARHLHLLAATGMTHKIIDAGKNWLVIPVIALMESVIHAVNAETPEFVPLATLQKAAASWNGKPVTLGHPKKNGKQCSASDDGILESHGIGVIKNSRVEGTKLLQEVWIDCERAKKLHPEMLARLEGNQTEEVSVGAFVVTDGKASNYKGKDYKASWIEASGDHLAFLPGGRGACSVEMGCGTHRAAMHLVTAEAIEEVSDTVLEALEVLNDAEPTALRTAIGARNSSKDARMIQTMHDHSVSLGAQCDRANYETAEGAHGETPCSCHKHKEIPEEKTLEERPIKFEGGKYVLYTQDGLRKLAEHISMVEAKAHAQAISLALAQRAT
jgi:hypothetical protein